MEITSSAYYANMKKYWRRRRYQRLNSGTNNRKKLKISRLGGATRRLWKLRTAPKLHCKIFSLIKFLAKIHNAYVDMMIQLTTNMGKLNDNGLFRGNKFAKDQQISVISDGEEVDSTLVLEIYKTLAASCELKGL